MGQFAGTGTTDTPTDPPVDDAATPDPPIADQMAADLQAALDADAAAAAAASSPESPDLGGGEPGASDQGNDGVPPATTPAAPAADFIQIGDMQIPVDQTEAIAGLIQWASSLTEEQAAAAFAISQQPATGATPATPPAEPPAPAVDPYADLRTTYPEIAEQLEAQAAAIEALKADLTPKVEQVEQMAARQAFDATAAHASEVEATVKAQFLADNKLTDEDYTNIAKTAGSLGLVAPLVEKFGLEDGFKRALDIGLTQVPELANRAVEQAVIQQTVSGKKEKAGALSPQGGSAPRTSPAPANLPIDEKRRAMTADIEQMINGG
jgi:hypothetical protein